MARKFAVLLVCLALAVGSGECTWGASLFREFAPAFAARPPETAICSANWRRVWWGGLFCGAPVCRHRPPTGRPTPPSPAAAQAGGWGKPKPKPKVPHTVAELREWGREWEVSATRQAAHAVRGFRTYCKTLCPVHLGGSHPTLSAPLLSLTVRHYSSSPAAVEIVKVQGFSILHAAVQGKRCRLACTPATATSWHVPAQAASPPARCTGSLQRSWGVRSWLQLALRCCGAWQFTFALLVKHCTQSSAAPLLPPCSRRPQHRRGAVRQAPEGDRLFPSGQGLH